MAPKRPSNVSSGHASSRRLAGRIPYATRRESAGDQDASVTFWCKIHAGTHRDLSKVVKTYLFETYINDVAIHASVLERM